MPSEIDIEKLKKDVEKLEKKWKEFRKSFAVILILLFILLGMIILKLL